MSTSKEQLTNGFAGEWTLETTYLLGKLYCNVILHPGSKDEKAALIVNVVSYNGTQGGVLAVIISLYSSVHI